MHKNPNAIEAHIEPLEIADEGSIVAPLGDIDFLHGWQPTSVATGKDLAESQRTAKAIKAPAQQCWFNARKAIFKLEDYTEASYVEGWASCKGMPIEHGWIIRNGAVIDPTLPADDIIYFPGLEFPGRTGIEAFLATKEGKKCKRSPFFYAFGWGGMLSPTFRKCYEQAMALLGKNHSGSAA